MKIASNSFSTFFSVGCNPHDQQAPLQHRLRQGLQTRVWEDADLPQHGGVHSASSSFHHGLHHTGG